MKIVVLWQSQNSGLQLPEKADQREHLTLMSLVMVNFQARLATQKFLQRL